MVYFVYYPPRNENKGYGGLLHLGCKKESHLLFPRQHPPPKIYKQNGNIKYCNKLVCKRCENKCTTAAFKEIEFNKNVLIKSSRLLIKDNPKSNQLKKPKEKLFKNSCKLYPSFGFE